MNVSSLLFTALLFVLLGACDGGDGDSYDDDSSSDKSESASEADVASTPQSTGGFAAVESVLDTNCLGCHSGSTAPNLEGYDNASRRATAILAAVEAGRMPPGGKLASSDIAKIKTWIDAGRPK